MTGPTYSCGCSADSDKPCPYCWDSESGRVRSCIVHGCGAEAAFAITLNGEARDYCWPCWRTRWMRHPWDKATNEDVIAPARTSS